MRSNKARKGNHRDSLTLMLVPHYSGKPVISLRLRRWVVYTFFSLLAFFIVFVIVSSFYSSSLTRKLINYSSLMAQNQYQKHQIGTLQKKMINLDTQVNELLERDQQIRESLGLGGFHMDKTANNVKKNFNLKSDDTLSKLLSLSSQIEFDLEIRQSSYESLKETVNEYQTRFAHTPSIWPVFGRLGSPYGWRKHPFTKIWRMHTGQDFPTWRGAPVKATADGIVEKSGIMSGYGLTIVIDHLYGLKTLYAHNDRVLVQSGMRVKKGQIIAEAGDTGISTGVHVHYEVLRNNQPIYPNRYLNLDLFTAAKNNYW